MAASTMCSGVRKSGWPMPRLMMSRPWAISALARASTAKAFSSPIRSKAAIVRSMYGLPRHCCPGSSADCGGKIKRLEGASDRVRRGSILAAHGRADVAVKLEADARIGVGAKVLVAPIDGGRARRLGRYGPDMGLGRHRT